MANPGMIAQEEVQVWWDAVPALSREQRASELGLAIEGEDWRADWMQLSKDQRERLLTALKHPLSGFHSGKEN